ncbi:MAG: hypothetical protein IPI46_13805 [Bacteroidetes bacterium]|nr:hypothetical protein [Bacteroidota bacterium]
MEAFFEKGDKVEIAKAKKAYRRQYQSQWKKNNRSISKEVTIKFAPDEFKEIHLESKRHQQKCAPFIKSCTIAYIRKTYIVPDSISINKILQLLKMMYIHVEDLVNEKGDGEFLLQAIRNLEHDIRLALLSPIDLEIAVKKYIEKNKSV